MKKIFLSLASIFFLTGCTQATQEQVAMFDGVRPLSEVNVQIQVHAIDEDTFGIQLVGITDAVEVYGMNLLLELPEGVEVTDVNLDPVLKDKGWLFVKNLEKLPVRVTSVGTEKVSTDMDIMTVDVKGESTENINAYVSVIEHETSYGDVFPFSFNKISSESNQ